MRCEATRRRASTIIQPWLCQPSVIVLSLSNRASHHSPPSLRSGAFHSKGASIFGGSSNSSGRGGSSSQSYSSSEESSFHIDMGDPPVILVYSS
jgi:hypothetical protein